MNIMDFNLSFICMQFWLNEIHLLENNDDLPDTEICQLIWR